MIAFGHTAVGTIVGLEVYKMFPADQPILGLLTAGAAGMVSHYIADFIPHGHFSHLKNYKKDIILVILFDVGLSVLLFSLAAYLSSPNSLKVLFVLFGIGGAQLPDILANLIELGFIPRKGFFKAELAFHESTHWHGKGIHALLLGWRDIWQVLMVVLALYLVLS